MPPDKSQLDVRQLERVLAELRCRLLTERSPEGYWTGDLSTSALSTATAAFALIAAGNVPEDVELARGGLDWLSKHSNPDGGWGDTLRSESNISTTTLCWAALGARPEPSERRRKAIDDAENWLLRHAGGLEPARLARAIHAVYGADRTFSVPILTMCAMSGRLGAEKDAWRYVLQLPFELAACPPGWFHALRLPVVSYALPALISMGQARHHHLPTRNPVCRVLRSLARRRTLDVLDRIQPRNGGFLEAVPLTSFVTMSLAASRQADHPVARRGLSFLRQSVREDGSWPIDTNLATWVTTLSVNALARTGDLERSLGDDERATVLGWLLAQQYREVHPYTNAAPGAWAWTDLPGGVPDGDDTPGALIALHHLARTPGEVREAAMLGVRWILDIQNKNGGVPTFCRGWGKLPFDKSGADLTAHALRALLTWRDFIPESGSRVTVAEVDAAIERAVGYLRRVQNKDGSWTPLWFGNQYAPNNENRTYGTSRVLVALRRVRRHDPPGAVDVTRLRTAAADWFLGAQNPDGGWGGAAAVESSVEETALAVEALADPQLLQSRPEPSAALHRGVAWLLSAVDSGGLDVPTPIGFYFASLWYYEKLYPLIFTLSALGEAKSVISDQ